MCTVVYRAWFTHFIIVQQTKISDIGQLTLPIIRTCMNQVSVLRVAILCSTHKVLGCRIPLYITAKLQKDMVWVNHL